MTGKALSIEQVKPAQKISRRIRNNYVAGDCKVIEKIKFQKKRDSSMENGLNTDLGHLSSYMSSKKSHKKNTQSQQNLHVRSHSRLHQIGEKFSRNDQPYKQINLTQQDIGIYDTKHISLAMGIQMPISKSASTKAPISKIAPKSMVVLPKLIK